MTKNGTRSKLDLVPFGKVSKSCRHMVDSVHSSLILWAFRGGIKSDSRQQLCKKCRKPCIYWASVFYVSIESVDRQCPFPLSVSRNQDFYKLIFTHNQDFLKSVFLCRNMLYLTGKKKNGLSSKGTTMQDNYNGYSDEELLIRLRDGEQGITDYIMNKYKNLVRSKAKSMYILGADREDLIQEGMIGLFKAIRDYDTGRDASFFTFADLCVSRQMYTAVQAAGRQKHAPLNTYISLYAGGAENDGSGKGEEWELVDSLTSGFEKNPEELLIDKENVELLEKVMERELSGFEKQVLDLYLTGMTYSQIARVLGRDDKSTDNALQRIKGKLKKAIIK